MFQVQFRNGTLEVPELQLCSEEQLSRAEAIVKDELPTLFALLPPGHVWNQGKLDHMGLVDTVKLPILEAFQGTMSDLNYRFLFFIYSIHDIGRVPEALRKLNRLPSDFPCYKQHAEATLIVLQQWKVFDVLSPEARLVINYAIERHIGQASPVLPDKASDIEKWMYLIACLLRDMDKYGIFYEKTDQYLGSAEKKRQEIEIHGYAGEQYRINPPTFLDAVSTLQVPPRNEIVSYEAYMLYFSSWVFDVNVVMVLRRIRETGAIDRLLAYFRSHLNDEQYERIHSAFTTFFEQFNR